MKKIHDSRDSILAKIKNNLPVSRKLPVVPMFDVPGNQLQNFVAHLIGFDGECRLFDSRKDALDWLKNNVLSKNKNCFSALPDLEGNFGSADSSASEMIDVDVCMAEASLAVGETGSLWLDSDSIGEPAAALFCTDLYLLIDRNALVSGLQEAYSMLNLAKARYSAFFSGPSATADIEAVHVTGAQGEMSLTALMYNCSEQDSEDVMLIRNRLPNGTPLGQPDATILSLRRQPDPILGKDSV